MLIDQFEATVRRIAIWNPQRWRVVGRVDDLQTVVGWQARAQTKFSSVASVCPMFVVVQQI